MKPGAAGLAWSRCRRQPTHCVGRRKGKALCAALGAHVRAFGYFGGVARQLVSDNLKAGVTRACFHEPGVNRTYTAMAAHYGTAIVPARPSQPRDKALASYCTLF